MKKILLVSSNFAPFQNTNALVIWRVYKELNSFYDIEVLTYNHKSNLTIDMITNEDVKNVNLEYMTDANYSLLRRVFESILAIKKRRKVGFDHIYSYHHNYESIYSIFLFTKLFSRKTTWIAHLSDPPIYFSPFKKKQGFKESIVSIISERIPFYLLSRYATEVIFNDKWQASFCYEKNSQIKRKMNIIQMGFDENNNLGNMQKKIKNGIDIAYFGNFYDKRDGKYFFDMVKEYKEEWSNIRFHIYGKLMGSTVDKYFRDLEKSCANVFLKGEVTYQESLILMKQFDILLVLDADFGSGTIYPYTPSKIIDYIGAQKPFFTVSSENSPSHDITIDVNCWYSNFEKERILETFKVCIDEFNSYKLENEKYESYSLKKQIEKIKKLIDNLN